MAFNRTIRNMMVTAALCGVLALSVSATEGTVSADSLRLRSSASTESTVLATLSTGTTLTITGDSQDGWYPVSYQSYTGFVSAEYVTFSTEATQVESEASEEWYGQVVTTGGTLNIRSGADTSYEKVGSLYNGAVVTIFGTEGTWYQISYNGIVGYVASEYMVEVSADALVASSAIGSQVVSSAMNYLGTPYVYGSNGPSSFDCSGFTSYIYSSLGYSLNRSANDQLLNGTSIAKSELQAGDLVFFAYNTTKSASHVGIYIGDGQFIHASTNGYQVRIDTLASGHYSDCYVGARRIA